ncbi:MAG: phosphatidate cytidylyltransferase [Bacilli bacterium]|nr:phosphatidate cytidylyltransferase [Bacilli bacterium]
MKTRVISAIIVAAIAIPFIYFGGPYFVVAIGIVSILAFLEVINLPKAHQKLPLIPTVLALIGLLVLICTNFNGDSTVYGATYARLIYLVLGLLIPTLFYKDNKYTTQDAFYLIGSMLFLGLAFNSILLVRDKGLAMFLFLVLIPICTDSFAMIFGSLIGKHKMCPTISPKKSWEGAVCGLILGTVIPVVFYMIAVEPLTWKIILGTMLLSAAGQFGDLIFSKIKRENGIKDFSNLMPGHGGALDRLDSIIAVFMTYIFLTIILF